MIWKLYLIALPIFFVIDMIWLGLVAKNFYREQIGFLMKTNVNWVAAIIFYLLFIFALVVFVINPAVEKKLWINALIYGALFGMITYAPPPPLVVTIVDIMWGTLLGASVSLISYFIAIKIGL